MIDGTFEAFKARKLGEGYDEVLLREWAPRFATEPHHHPFDTDAVVACGEFWLTINSETTHYHAGDAFKVDRGVVHSEQYGPNGATFWAARRY